MSDTKPGEIEVDTESPLAAEQLQAERTQLAEGAQENVSGAGADGEPAVTNPDRAGETEQTGGWGTGTPGSSNVAGLHDVAPIESEVVEGDEGEQQGQGKHD